MACPTIILTPSNLPSGIEGIAYNQIITEGGGAQPFVFMVTSGSLPPGLSLTGATSSSISITGTPTLAGSYTFTITGTANGGCTGSRSYTIIISPAACPVINVYSNTSINNLPNGQANVAYGNFQFFASGGIAPYTFSITGGVLPTGLNITSGGLLSGTPTVPGVYDFIVTATDANGCIGTIAQTVIIASNGCTGFSIGVPIGGSTLSLGIPVNQQFTTSGSVGAVQFYISGILPPGLTFDPTTGIVSGTPTVSGVYSFFVLAVDSNGCIGVLPTTGSVYTYIVNNSGTCLPINFIPNFPILPNGNIGTAYLFALAGSPASSYTFSLSFGILPDGLTLNSNGQITGIPTRAGTFIFLVQIMNNNTGCLGAHGYIITILSCPIITVLPVTLPNGKTGSFYNQQLSASGGSAPYTFAVTSGSLPAGISLQSNGILSGYPTLPGTYTFTITATDSNGCTGSRIYTIIIGLGSGSAYPIVEIDPCCLQAARDYYNNKKKK